MSDTEIHQFVSVSFHRFKAFHSFTLNLRHFNILVGPNNAGKSTILAAFRILAAAMRKASTRSSEVVSGPEGRVYGYTIDLKAISVAEENIFYNYEDTEPAKVTFKLSNKNQLELYFPERGSCFLIPITETKQIRSPSSFRSNFNCQIGFVPILGPVEHNENLFEKEAARLALLNYRAARNFRNIWYHFPERFEEFKSALARTWPGMEIDRPIVDYSNGKPRLHMFCPEDRIPREIFWAGFGFQVWCQMLTHLIQSRDVALFLIDEPDIYLHSDLQRQLLGLLRELGPDILVATHSTEIISEAETDDILLVDKRRRVARRIKRPSQLEEVFKILGSNLNPTLTQLAKTRRAIFVEGKDFQIISKFANKLGRARVANRSHFAVVPVEGFNPERIRSLKRGMETTIGGNIAAAAILDRDFRCEAECIAIAEECKSFCDLVSIHSRKEIENFALVPVAIDRSAARKIVDRTNRSGEKVEYQANIAKVLEEFARTRKSYVTAQYLANCRRFERAHSPNVHETTVSEAALEVLEKQWENFDFRLKMIPGKEAISEVNKYLQEAYKVTVTATSIVDAMRVDEVPAEIRDLVEAISSFASKKVL